MNYPSLLLGLLTCQAEPFQVANSSKGRRYALLNLLLLGLFFGLSNFFAAMTLTPELPVEGKYLFLTPLIFCIAGTVTIAGAQLGFCLIYWAAARAFGGPGLIPLVFNLTALTLPPFWIAAPLINYLYHVDTSRSLSMVLLIIIGPSLLWSFLLIRKSLEIGQGISARKASIAVCCMWIFSISSIYVFQP